MGSKRVEAFEDVEAFVEKAFPKSARQPREEYRDAVAILVPTVVVVKRKGKLDEVAINAILNGAYVRLDGASKRDVLEGLDLVKVVARKGGAKGFDLIDDLELQVPS